MTKEPTYKLTEEVVRQAVEVCFKLNSHVWQISFTNPTAGPWKKIRIGDYITGGDLRYAKEEDRPDLILFSAQYGVFLILEAKDNIAKLLSTGQLIKSMAVFEKEIARIDGILDDAPSSAQVFAQVPRPENIRIVLGYIFSGSGHNLVKQREELHEVHSKLSRLEDRVDERLHGCLSFIVQQNEHKDLLVYYDFYDLSEELCSVITKTLPDNMKLLSK